MTGVIALGTAGNRRGVAFPGVTSEKVYLDSSVPVAFFTRTAGSMGFSNVWPSATCSIPYNPAIAGTKIWGQCAWNDSATGALLFTRASSDTIPRLPRTYRRKVLYQRDNTLKCGSGTLSDGLYVTVARYTK